MYTIFKVSGFSIDMYKLLNILLVVGTRIWINDNPGLFGVGGEAIAINGGVQNSKNEGEKDE